MKSRVLFVDDEPSMLELVSSYFREEGVDAATALTGNEALRLARENQFDLIVLDIHLSDENGLLLLTQFKKSHPTLPVVLFTGLPKDDELVDQALVRGASGFMRKTDSLDDLFKAVRSYLPSRSN
jgi:DNA-binding response OmpR family regulator